jgi:hypothetical protein
VQEFAAAFVPKQGIETEVQASLCTPKNSLFSEADPTRNMVMNKNEKHKDALQVLPAVYQQYSRAIDKFEMSGCLYQ